jgi:hypothetical protein
MELYLADAHPNGAGLVEWIKDNWNDLLDGLLFPSGGSPFDIFGRMLEREIARGAAGSPDSLLCGYGNRNLHGLMDYRLGMDLVASLRDSTYIPGVSSGVIGRSSSTMPCSWATEAASLRDRVLSAMPGSRTTAHGATGATALGWTDAGELGIFNAVVHPSWNVDGLDPGTMQPIHVLAQRAGAQQVRFWDTFNLSRRFSWLVLHKTRLPSVPVNMSGGPTVAVHGFTPMTPSQPLSIHTPPGHYLGTDRSGKQNIIIVLKLGLKFWIKGGGTFDLASGANWTLVGKRQ